MKNNPVFKSLTKNGLYAGAILAAYFVLLYLIGINFMGTIFSLVNILVEGVVLFLFAFFSISQTRGQLPNNKISYLKAWLAAGGTYYIGLLIFGITKILVLFVIDPAYFDTCIQELRTIIIENAEHIPNPEEKLEQIEAARSLTKNLISLVTGYIIISAIFGAFIALVAKRKNRLEETL